MTVKKEKLLSLLLSTPCLRVVGTRCGRRYDTRDVNPYRGVSPFYKKNIIAPSEFSKLVFCIWGVKKEKYLW